jgi:amino acid permease
MRYTVRFGDLAVPDPWAAEWNWQMNAGRPSRVCNAIRGTGESDNKLIRKRDDTCSEYRRDAMSATPTLKKALSQRQLTMIAIGGVIGAGLFVGSGVVIGDTGPGAFITYALAGVLIIMVMRMLAEMAVANPSTGSFADYARNALGNWAGFSVGWLYWYFWVIVVGFEAIAGAKIIQYWVNIPLCVGPAGLDDRN